MLERLLVIGGFLSYCLILSFWGVERDRPAWRVLACFGCLDIGVELLFSDGHGPGWTESINATREIAVLWALFVFAWSPAVVWMMAVVGLFCIAHLCLYLDVETGSSLIHDNYEITIRGLIVLLAALGTNGAINVAKGIRDRLHAGNLRRLRGIQLDIHRVPSKKQASEDQERIIR